MKRQRFVASLLCCAALLSGCGEMGGGDGSASSGSGGGTASRPMSELEQLAARTAAWESAGCYDDEAAYRETLLRAAELARSEDRGAYLCGGPKELSEDKLAALTDAAMRCHYAFGVYSDFDPYGEYMYATVALLLTYTPGTLETSIFDNTKGYAKNLQEGCCYVTVKEEDIQPFLDRSLRPVGEAFREYSKDPSVWEQWGWRDRGDGYVYVHIGTPPLFDENGNSPYNATPCFTGIEPLGGNRYLVTCDMMRDPSSSMGIWNQKLALVVEDLSLPSEPPYLSVLDCVAGEQDTRELIEIAPEGIEGLRNQYTVPQEDNSGEALSLLARLEALSPIPYYTELAGEMSPAMEAALADAKYVAEMTSGDTFESYVQSLNMRAVMYRSEFAAEDDWTPADPAYGYTYGDAWNVIPAEELEHAFQQRFGIDLTANGRAWLNDRTFVPDWEFTGGPMAGYDGENYIVYLRGIGGPMPFSYETSLVYNYDGTYTAVFTFVPDEWYDASGTLTLRLRNIGTEEAPFFQLLGYELPM